MTVEAELIIWQIFYLLQRMFRNLSFSHYDSELRGDVRLGWRA
jgi:hypothetical protein